MSELVQQADVALRGHVISAQVEPHPDLPHITTLVVSVRVEKALKGAPGEVYTFRQMIWDLRDRYDKAGYHKGQEVLLLMNRLAKNGLTSPAGMEQGRFRVQRENGKAKAINGRGNVGLMEQAAEKARGRRLSARAAAVAKSHRSGAIELDALEEIIAALAVQP